MSETECMQFVAERDGFAAAKTFAEQTLAIYRTAAVKMSPYAASIKEIEAWLSACDPDHRSQE